MKSLKNICLLIIILLIPVFTIGCGKNKANDSFSEEKITIGEGDNKLNGILTLPKNVEKPPVVIMVQGTGASDMDETLGKENNKPFKDIAKGLAENGIASIRYNKRFYQYPYLASSKVTIEEEVLNDVNFAIELAYKNKSINNEEIYILGHSLGGMLAPHIAKENEQVKGIISLAGSPRKLEDLILDQNKEIIDNMKDKTNDEKDSILNEVETEVNKIKELNSNDYSKVIFGINSEYWISLNNINTPEIVRELNVPMLFLQGEEDFQVYKDIDFKEWKKILENNEMATFKLYPSLNHLFMKTNGKRDITEYDKKGNVDSRVILDMANWINK